MEAKVLRLKINNYWLLLALVLLVTLLSLSYNSIQNLARPAESIVKGIQYRIDTETQLDIKAAIELAPSDWQIDTLNGLSFGMSTKPYWFKFVIPKFEYQQQRLIALGYPLLDNVSVWFVGSDGILTEYHTGDSLLFHQRPRFSENFVFTVPTVKHPLTVYIRVQTTGAVRLPVSILTEPDYTRFISQHSIVMGLFFGFLLAMAVSNFFSFSTTRMPIFAIYSGHVIFLGLTLATLNGLGYQYLWSESPWFQQHALAIFANLTGAFSIAFCYSLLNIKHYSKKLSRLLKVIIVFYLFSSVVSLFTPLSMFVSVFLVMLLASWVLIYGVGIWLWFKGLTIAGVYTIAWSVLFICGFTISIDNLNLIKLSIPSDYLLALAAGIEALLLALVLAINHNQQRLALLEVQSQLLTKTMQEKSDQDDILAMQESTQEDLEYKVQERTLELEVALRELSDINRELQEKNTLDALTGVRNRSYFDKKYVAEIRRSRRERTQLSIVMLDIDNFKSINDKYGHLVGDDCIKAVAATIKNALKRPSDDLCRYGGEEFVLILPSTELAGANILVEQIRQTIEQTAIQSDGFVINLTISAGIATAIANPDEAEDAILAAADQQLYLAKNAGRNNTKGTFLPDSSDQIQD
ncbi:diguanylate cyclase [Paraglaciecola sp.]|uniref:sensor domain-containing diguanylate cyclase n=1 Tax=Paraglaciecola sp. TaxID=1920173 RepID=UPI0030F43B33